MNFKVNFGIIAVDHTGAFLHFCGYEEPPTKTDYSALEAELKTDPEFGLTDKPFVLVQAPAEILEHFRKMVK